MLTLSIWCNGSLFLIILNSLFTDSSDFPSVFTHGFIQLLFNIAMNRIKIINQVWLGLLTFFSNYQKWDVISWIIDEVLTFLRTFSYLLNCLLYEVVRPLILIRKHNLRRLIALKYIILRTGSGLKLLFLAKMAFSVIFVFFERLLVWGYITPLINQKTVMVSFRSTLSNTGSDDNSLFSSERK